MKKIWLIIISIVLLVAVAAIGSITYVINTPEYALKEIIDDVKADGIEGLYPHLTGEARKTLDAVSSTTESNLFNSIVNLVGQSQYVNVLKSEIQRIQWSVNDVLKGKKSTSVILSFNYEDKLMGTIELTMVRENREWKISGLNAPKFDKIEY